MMGVKKRMTMTMTSETREDGGKEKLSVIAFGPTIVRVSIKDFSSTKIDKQQTEEIWRRLIGPSVERNMLKRHEMWRIITFAYMEGLQHGSSLTLERVEEEKKQSDQPQLEPIGWQC